MAGKHTMDGKVTKVDAKEGWVDVKTPEGSMKLHFPSPRARQRQDRRQRHRRARHDAAGVPYRHHLQDQVREREHCDI